MSRATDKTRRIREVVYVVGAGFSAGLGYPLTNALLSRIWNRLEDAQRKQLRKIVKFHHPDFDPKDAKTYPDMERFMTEMQVNLDLFGSSRPAEGNFTREALEEARISLLLSIGSWFHDLFPRAKKKVWLSTIVD